VPVTPRPLVITNDFLPDVGGIQYYLGEILRRLPDAAVVAPSHPDADSHDPGLAYPVHRFGDPTGQVPGLDGWVLPTAGVTARVRQVAAIHDANVVICAAPWPLVPAALGLDLPVVVMTHGAELVLPARVPAVARVLGRQLGAANLLTTVSTWTGRHLRRLVGPDGPPIRLVRPGVDAATFSPDADGEAIRARHALGTDPTAVFVGRHVPRKGIDVLVDHWSAVRRKVPNARLLVTGDGRLTPSLRDRVAARGDDAIVLAGRVPWEELPAHHGAADVFVHPNRSRWGGLEQEGFGVIFLEAQAVGRPVIAGDSGGSPETLVPGETGLLVDGDDPASVVAAIVELLTNREHARTMGAAGREFVRREFDWDDIVAGLRDDLTAVVAGRRPKSSPGLG